MTLPIANWNYPTSVKVGAANAQWCASLGMKRPLLVTDPGLAALPMTVKLLDSCRSAGLDAGLFHAIKGNPTGKNVDDGVAAFRPAAMMASSHSAAARRSMPPRRSP